MKKYIPDIVTGLRAVGALLLLFTDTFSAEFYIVYSVCGVSDAADGFLARQMKVQNEFGAKLDSVADLMFYSAMIIKLMPRLVADMPVIGWIAVAAVFAVRITSYSVAAFKYRRFASMHTYGNKFTGLMIFTVPYMYNFVSITVIWAVMCAVSGFSSVEELIIHLTSDNYNPDRKALVGKA